MSRTNLERRGWKFQTAPIRASAFRAERIIPGSADWTIIGFAAATEDELLRKIADYEEERDRALEPRQAAS